MKPSLIVDHQDLFLGQNSVVAETREGLLSFLPGPAGQE